MKLIIKIIIAILIVGGIFLLIKNNKMNKDGMGISEESIGLRKTTLYSENTTTSDETNYSKAPAGTSTRFPRAYFNAPPMIPHDATGFMPITKDSNACVGCHMPSVALSMGATPIPKSHFTNYRPKHTYNKNGFKRNLDHMKSETLSEALNTMSNARFNCTQCHAVQTQGNLAVENNF